MNKFNLNDHNRRYKKNFPIEIIMKHAKQTTSQKVYAFQQRVDSINSAFVITKLNIFHASFKFAKHLMNPFFRHMKLVNRLIIYLK